MRWFTIFILLMPVIAIAQADSGYVDLTWSAPGDDGNIGIAAAYVIRASFDSIIDDSSWENATGGNYSGEGIPQPAGETETFRATGFPVDTLCFFAIKTVDEHGNVSELSNCVGKFAQAPPDSIPPAAITDLR